MVVCTTLPSTCPTCDHLGRLTPSRRDETNLRAKADKALARFVSVASSQVNFIVIHVSITSGFNSTTCRLFCAASNHGYLVVAYLTLLEATCMVPDETADDL